MLVEGGPNPFGHRVVHRHSVPPTAQWRRGLPLDHLARVRGHLDIAIGYGAANNLDMAAKNDALPNAVGFIGESGKAELTERF